MLKNIDKLRLVPSFALRKILQEMDKNNAARYEKMSHERMIQAAEIMAGLTSEDIERVYENYRYGGRVSFYIYLVPENAETFNVDDLNQSLEAAKDEEQENAEGNSIISKIKILNHEKLGGDLIELHFKYVLKKHYLDENEEIQPYSESRFGFVWFDFKNKYISMLSKDERVNAVIIGRIADLIGGNPLSVILPKDLVNKFFNFDDLLGVSHYDPITGIRHKSFGRDLTKNSEYREEVKKRDASQIRSGSFYSEPIPDGTVSGVGVVTDKGKIYLLKTLSTSSLRGWAQKRLPELISGIRDLQQIGSKEYLQTVKSNFRFQGIGQEGKSFALSLAEKVLACRKQGRTSIPLEVSVEQTFQELSRFFFPSFYPYCSQCGNNVEALCPNCLDVVIKPTPQGFVCDNCSTAWKYQSQINVKCDEGHTIKILNPIDSLTLLPKEALLEKIYDELNKIETVHFDSKTESFCIHGSTFYYWPQDNSVRYKLEELEGFEQLPALPTRESDDYRRYQKQIRQLKEVCISPGVTKEMCAACIDQDGDQCCLMKIFHKCAPGYLPAPHHGGEFGDVSFPTKLNGRETYFKGLLKGFKIGEVSLRDTLGRDITSQIMAQDAKDRMGCALAIITSTRLSVQLENTIEWLVRQYQGKLCFVREDQLIRILMKHLGVPN